MIIDNKKREKELALRRILNKENSKNQENHKKSIIYSIRDYFNPTIKNIFKNENNTRKKT
jgi:hypothetical protein